MSKLKLQTWRITDINGCEHEIHAHYIERWDNLQIVFFYKEDGESPRIVAHFAKWTHYVALTS